MKKHKFGATYSVWDGLELLESSLRSIRGSCDYINIVYSNESWYGRKSPRKILPILQDLMARGLCDEIIEYKVDIKRSPTDNETRKRNMGMKAAVRAGVHYLMSMDADEFYVASELEAMKSEIIERGITHSYVCTLRYKNTAEQYVLCDKTWPEFIQTFCRVNRFSRYGSRNNMKMLVDPSRGVKNRLQIQKHFLFRFIWAHHYSGYRKDMASKFKNSSGAKNYQKNYQCKIHPPTIRVKNTFNLPVF